MKLILFIIAVFCISVKAETADTLKLSDGTPLLLSDGTPILLQGESEPTPIQGGWLKQPSGRGIYFPNGKAIITSD